MNDEFWSFWSFRRIAITGAGGTVGSELMRQLTPYSVLAIDHSESALYELEERTPYTGKHFHLADVRDRDRLKYLFNRYKIDAVFNCAAIKHVPACERDLNECWKTNVEGFRNVCTAAESTGAKLVVQVSTDKATNAVGELGRSKALAEKIALEAWQCRVTAVRFHNIMGSSGSVLRKFKQQVAEGHPVTVTHRDMKRWFCTAERAVELLLRCAEHAASPDGRSLYVLQAGSPVRIVDLARQVIGEKDIEIVYTGIRPGERLEEKLWEDDEQPVDVGVEGVLAIEPRGPATGDRRGTQGVRDSIRTDSVTRA